MTKHGLRHQGFVLGAVVIAVAAAGAGAGAWLVASRAKETDGTQGRALNQAKHAQGLFSPTQAQWATLTIEPVRQIVFRPEHITEGNIAIDEDRSTLIFSPYAGRVTTLLVKPGDYVE